MRGQSVGMGVPSQLVIQMRSPVLFHLSAQLLQVLFRHSIGKDRAEGARWLMSAPGFTDSRIPETQRQRHPSPTFSQNHWDATPTYHQPCPVGAISEQDESKYRHGSPVCVCVRTEPCKSHACLAARFSHCVGVCNTATVLPKQCTGIHPLPALPPRQPHNRVTSISIFRPIK